MVAISEAYDLTCVIHVHSTHSDGSGTVPQIARAAQRATSTIPVVMTGLIDHERRGTELALS